MTTLNQAYVHCEGIHAAHYTSPVKSDSHTNYECDTCGAYYSGAKKFRDRKAGDVRRRVDAFIAAHKAGNCKS